MRILTIAIMVGVMQAVAAAPSESAAQTSVLEARSGTACRQCS